MMEGAEVQKGETLIQDDTGTVTMGTVLANAVRVLGARDGAWPLTCRTSLTLHSRQKEGATLSHVTQETGLWVTQLVSD